MSAPDGIDVATGEVLATTDFRLSWEPMTATQAEEATAKANAYLIRSPQLVRDLKDGKAWEALGYPSWHAFVDDRLVISVQYADLLVKFAERLELLAEAVDVDASLLAVNERALRGLPAETMVSAATEAVADLGDSADDLERAQVAAEAARKANADRIEEAARRGREKAEADLAVARAEKARAEAEAEQARQERAAKRAADKAAKEAGLAAASPAGEGEQDGAGERPPAAGDPGTVLPPLPFPETVDGLLALDPAEYAAALAASDDATRLEHGTRRDDIADLLHRIERAIKEQNG